MMKKRSLLGAILGFIASGCVLFSGIIALIVYYSTAVVSSNAYILCIWQPIVFDVIAGILILVGSILDLSKPKAGGGLIVGGTTLILIGLVLRLIIKDELSTGLTIGLSWLWFIAFFLGVASAILSFALIREVPQKNTQNNNVNYQ